MINDMPREGIVKREVYNGYEEFYMTGLEIKSYFEGCYETFGRHHEKIASKRIDFDSKYLKVNDNIRYRLFIKENSFVRIMDIDTDKKKYFFGYTKERPTWAKD